MLFPRCKKSVPVEERRPPGESDRKPSRLPSDDRPLQRAVETEAPQKAGFSFLHRKPHAGNPRPVVWIGRDHFCQACLHFRVRGSSRISLQKSPDRPGRRPSILRISRPPDFAGMQVPFDGMRLRATDSVRSDDPAPGSAQSALRHSSTCRWGRYAGAMSALIETSPPPISNSASGHMNSGGMKSGKPYG